METENELYERTVQDVGQMIQHAKLNAKNLTEITQALYYPQNDTTSKQFKLLELTPHLLTQIQTGNTVYLKGGLNEKLVLCTDTKTYDVKEAEISNSLLLVPDFKDGQSTSRSPLKSPRSKGMNRSLDNSVEENNGAPEGEAIDCVERQLERKNVLTICHEYFECREINPRFRKLGELLNVSRYSGSENEYCIEKNLLFTFDQLLDTTQCSRSEFMNGLREYRAFEIQGRYRVLEYQYEYRVITLMLGVMTENSWPLNEIDKDETLNALKDIVPLEVVNGLFDLYTIIGDDNKFEYRTDMICRIIAQNILQQGYKFHLDDFMTTWQDALPEGMHIDENYLVGIGLIDRDASIHCVRALIEATLPTSLLERLKVLFQTKDRWTLEQIEPYIQYFATPQLTVTSILTKHARSVSENGVRKYVSKH